MSLRVICAFGTRPEKIKLAPVVEALREKGVEVVEWCSGQSRDLVESDGRLSTNWHDGVGTGVGRTMEDFADIWRFDDAPDCVIVQGDTATAFACAQAAFLARVPVAHVEAGLRTYASEPWPEEAFRRQIAAVARWHFCPDYTAKFNVAQEIGLVDEGSLCRGVDERVFVTGNTIIDTLPRVPLRVLVTLHRRENWGARIEGALRTLFDFSESSDVEVRAIRHPNWSGHQSEALISAWAERIDFLPPLVRDDLLREMERASVVVTDSGGLQEEAAHLGIPCLVLRTATERTALAQNGAIKLVNPDDPGALRRELESILARRRAYGDGTSGKKVAEILVRELTGVDSNGS